MMEEVLLADLVTALPPAVRMQRIVHVVRKHFGCDAVAVLHLQEDCLIPVATEGLVHEALGRRFRIALHPRFAAILGQREPVRFMPGSELADPYDGLLETQAGVPLPVHDCMGVSLHIEGVPWGVLTLDALATNTFNEGMRGDLGRHIILIEAAIRMTRLEDEVRSLRINPGSVDAISSLGQGGDESILGRSAELQSLLHELKVVAGSDLPVLLLGETGVGKELFARYLHRHSERDKALVQVNCAALPESLAESELFGHVKGAFSGATTDRPGRFEAADGSTLFLDEVGELPLAVQAKLLRALQNGEIQRLGEDHPRHVNVRIIAATNRDLLQSVREGAFRADLYHRLSVYPVPIPPLRERGQDILLLAGHFLELNRARLGLRSLRLSMDAETLLLRYPWPGNIRELEHVISRAAIKAVSRGASRKDIVTLEPSLLDVETQVNMPGLHVELPVITPADAALPFQTIVAIYERQVISTALVAEGGSWAATARRLSLDPSNLHKLAKRLGLKE